MPEKAEWLRGRGVRLFDDAVEMFVDPRNAPRVDRLHRKGSGIELPESKVGQDARIRDHDESTETDLAFEHEGIVRIRFRPDRMPSVESIDAGLEEGERLAARHSAP